MKCVSHVEKFEFRFLHNKQKVLGFQSHIWFWSLLLYKISVKYIIICLWQSYQVWGFFTFLADLAYCVPWQFIVTVGCLSIIFITPGLKIIGWLNFLCSTKYFGCRWKSKIHYWKVNFDMFKNYFGPNLIISFQVQFYMDI